MDKKFIIGMIGATVAGVIIGMLVAPEAGSDIRKKISDNATDWAHKLVDLFGNIKDEGETAMAKAKDAMNAPAAE